MKVYYDIGINNDNGFFTIRFSNDGKNYLYAEFDNLPDIFTFQTKVSIGVNMYKQYLEKGDLEREQRISSLDTDQEIGNRE